MKKLILPPFITLSTMVVVMFLITSCEVNRDDIKPDVKKDLGYVETRFTNAEVNHLITTKLGDADLDFQQKMIFLMDHINTMLAAPVVNSTGRTASVLESEGTTTLTHAALHAGVWDEATDNWIFESTITPLNGNAAARKTIRTPSPYYTGASASIYHGTATHFYDLISIDTVYPFTKHCSDSDVEAKSSASHSSLGTDDTYAYVTCDD